MGGSPLPDNQPHLQARALGHYCAPPPNPSIAKTSVLNPLPKRKIVFNRKNFPDDHRSKNNCAYFTNYRLIFNDPFNHKSTPIFIVAWTCAYVLSQFFVSSDPNDQARLNRERQQLLSADLC